MIIRTIAMLLALATPGMACAVETANVVPEMDRVIKDERPVDVILASREIQTTVDIGRVASSANGGGLIGALIISATDDKRDRLTQTAKDQAEATIRPLREALRGFDVDALALSTTKAALGKPDWFRPGAINSITSATPSTAPTSASQSATVVYRLETSPDFTQIRVIADLRLLKPQTSPALFYRQQVSSIVVLQRPSLEPAENVAKWTAGDGQLAKSALTNAFARLEQLLPFALELKAAQAKAIAAKERPRVFGAGYYGPMVERPGAAPGETLLWKNGLISVTQSAD